MCDKCLCGILLREQLSFILRKYTHGMFLLGYVKGQHFFPSFNLFSRLPVMCTIFQFNAFPIMKQFCYWISKIFSVLKKNSIKENSLFQVAGAGANSCPWRVTGRKDVTRSHILYKS